MGRSAVGTDKGCRRPFPVGQNKEIVSLLEFPERASVVEALLFALGDRF